MINTTLLAEICEAAGAPGHEQRIREIVLREVKPLVDEIKIDNMGNVVAIKKGKENKKVMIAAHMDEIGFIVTHIDDNGFIYFHTLGGFDPKTLTAQRVIIELRDKVSLINENEDMNIGLSNSKREEALSALEVLGYSRKQTTKVVDKLVGEVSEISVEEIIKSALNKL